jgi:hypothetical protein
MCVLKHYTSRIHGPKRLFLHYYFLWLWCTARAMASLFTRFRDHTQRRTTVSRTHLDEWSARRRDLYLTAHKHTQHSNIPAPSGIRPHDRSRRAAVDLCLRPRGHWDRLISCLGVVYFCHRESCVKSRTYRWCILSMSFQYTFLLLPHPRWLINQSPSWPEGKIRETSHITSLYTLTKLILVLLGASLI